MKTGKIRPITICLLLDEGRLFVFEGYDTVKKQTFYRPLGGAIEFGETSDQALRREMREEVNAELTNLRYLGALENIFTCDGKMGHEIVLVYRADFSDPVMYSQDVIMGNDDGGEMKSLWKPLAEFASGQAILVPNGLLEMLAKDN